MMHITAQAVASGLGADGRRLGIGDVVWGKIHGFPWWPGKVLSITSDSESPGVPQQAHVAWYGSSTSSLMPCDQLSPFLENFKVLIFVIVGASNVYYYFCRRYVIIKRSVVRIRKR